MAITGTVRGRTIEMDGKPALPDGTRVTVIPELPAEAGAEPKVSLTEWLEDVRAFRESLPVTEDSVEILRRIRLECADR
jgi:hypothetical protein